MSNKPFSKLRSLDLSQVCLYILVVSIEYTECIFSVINGFINTNTYVTEHTHKYTSTHTHTNTHTHTHH